MANPFITHPTFSLQGNLDFAPRFKQPAASTTIINNFITNAPPITPVTPTFDPKIEANALYGKNMPLFVGGFARIGSSPAPILGPYLNNGTASFIVSFGVPANPNEFRFIYAIYLDNEKVWTHPTGGHHSGQGTFLAEPFEFEFRGGALTQTIDALETLHFPGEENAYRPQMILSIRNIPYARFVAKTGKPIPYVACDIGDQTDAVDPHDGITVGEAYERVAYSPWYGYTPDTFETEGITDLTDGILIKDNADIIQLCQSLTSVKTNISLLQSDKLRLRDSGANVTPAIVFDRDTLIAKGGVEIVRQDASEMPRELELLTVDPDQDYTIVPSLSKRPRDPVAVSAAVGKRTITLPLIMDAEVRQAAVTLAHYATEQARKKVTFSTTIAGYEVEPGDLVALNSIADGIDNEVYKVIETSHNGDFTVTITAEAILRCGVTYAPVVGFLSSIESAASSPTYTYNSVGIGVAASDRLIVIVARVMRSQSVPRSITSVTLNGTPMTQHAYQEAGDVVPSANGAVTQGIWSMPVPSGTTATVVVNADLTAGGSSIDVFRLAGLGSITPHDTLAVMTNGGDPAGTIDIPFNGTLIASYLGSVPSIGAVTWTGVNTAHTNEEIAAGSLWWGSTGSQGSMTIQTARPLSVTSPATGYESIVAVSFG